MRRVIWVFIFLFTYTVQAQEQDTTVLSTAQTKSKIRYRGSTFAVPFRQVRDEGHSPLLHNGPVYQFSLFNERIRSYGFTKIEFIVGYGRIKTDKKKVTLQTRVPTLNLELTFNVMKKVATVFNSKGTLFLGLMLVNRLDGRLYLFLPNNSFGYEFSNALHPASEFRYAFNLGKTHRAFQAGVKLNTALLAHVIRPNFMGMEPPSAYLESEINPLALFTNYNKIALPNTFFTVNTEVYLDRYKLSSSSKIRFFYGWGIHYVSLAQSNPMVSAYHSIGISSIIYSEKVKKSIFNRNL